MLIILFSTLPKEKKTSHNESKCAYHQKYYLALMEYPFWRYIMLLNQLNWNFLEISLVLLLLGTLIIIYAVFYMKA